MTPDRVLADVRGYAAAGRYVITGHALKRMAERNIREADIGTALRGARRCAAAAEPERWKVTGPDLDGDDLDVVVAIDGGIVVVTVW